MPELRAQDNEDVLLWGLFNGQQSGFLIEAGAFDGYTLSVSYLFECVGWNGLLVEPLPDRASACIAKRSHSRTVQSALSAHGAAPEATFTRVLPDELLSYLSITETHSNRLERERELRHELVRVPVLSLDAVLDGHDGTIDFVSLDVEGSEVDVLDGFDLARWRPRALLIEDSSLGVDRRVRARLGASGYVHVVTSGINDLYVRRDEQRLVENFRAWWGDIRPVWSGPTASAGRQNRE
jgi:FkbM family methyltransferase